MKQYLKLLDTIMDEGVYKPGAREGLPGSMSLFGYQFRHNLERGFPLLTTKEMFFKGVVVELLWFLGGDTNIKYLLDNGVNIWNDDAYNFYRIKCEQYNFNPWPKEEFLAYIRKFEGDSLLHNEIPNYKFGDCGYQYGKVWRDWTAPEFLEGEITGQMTCVDQIVRVINNLRTNPQSRRHIVTAVDPLHDEELALYWCHSMFQFNCRPLSVHELGTQLDLLKPHIQAGDGISWFDAIGENDDEYRRLSQEVGLPLYKLDCQLYQRSADTVLGVPFNIASYALLTHIIAKFCNMIPGHFIHTFGDVHIYENHYEAVKTQMLRDPLKLPTIEVDINHFVKDLDAGSISLQEVLKSLSLDNFRLIDYNFQQRIKAELNTGTGKK